MSAARPAAPRAWVDLARHAARPEARDQGLVHAQRLLVFELDGAPYALPIERVREIVRRRPITPVPRLPAEVLGVISLRGRVIEVIDLRRRLGLGARDPAPRSRIVVAHDGEGRVVGLLVDSVEAVVPAGEVAPGGGPAVAVEGLSRVGGRFVSIVDLDRVMDFDAAG
jgi:purine-binding chemotaxis protein CheW